jgi:hypothetical protein
VVNVESMKGTEVARDAKMRFRSLLARRILIPQGISHFQLLSSFTSTSIFLPRKTALTKCGYMLYDLLNIVESMRIFNHDIIIVPCGAEQCMPASQPITPLVKQSCRGNMESTIAQILEARAILW